jgi:FkbM family methyltransferase
MKWPTSAVCSQLPPLHRMWAGYLRAGPKRSSGGVAGGSLFFRVLVWLGRASKSGLLTLRDPTVPYSITIDLQDFESFNHTIDLWLYGCDESRLIQALFGPGRVFTDVGANLGIFSLLAAWQGGETSQVHAFEPQPRPASAIRESVRVNRFSNLAVHQAVVSDKDDESVHFFLPRIGSGVASLSRRYTSSRGNAEEILCRSLSRDAFFSSRPPGNVDLIKIDVEGHEALVLAGAVNTIRQFQPIIWFEINPFALKTAGLTQIGAFRILEDCGYADFYELGALMSGYVRRVAPEFDHLVNVIAVPPGRRQWLESAVGKAVSPKCC